MGQRTSRDSVSTDGTVFNLWGLFDVTSSVYILETSCQGRPRSKGPKEWFCDPYTYFGKTYD